VPIASPAAAVVAPAKPPAKAPDVPKTSLVRENFSELLPGVRQDAEKYRMCNHCGQVLFMNITRMRSHLTNPDACAKCPEDVRRSLAKPAPLDADVVAVAGAGSKKRRQDALSYITARTGAAAQSSAGPLTLANGKGVKVRRTTPGVREIELQGLVQHLSKQIAEKDMELARYKAALAAQEHVIAANVGTEIAAKVSGRVNKLLDNMNPDTPFDEGSNGEGEEEVGEGAVAEELAAREAAAAAE